MGLSIFTAGGAASQDLGLRQGDVGHDLGFQRFHRVELSFFANVPFKGHTKCFPIEIHVFANDMTLYRELLFGNLVESRSHANIGHTRVCPSINHHLRAVHASL